MIEEFKDNISVLLEANDEDIDRFMKWAFGEQFHKLDHSLLFMESWNLLHKEELSLYSAGYVQDDLKKMIALYRKFHGILKDQ